MVAFVHGVLAWGERRETVQEQLKDMLAATAHCAWEAADDWSTQGARFACALGVQSASVEEAPGVISSVEAGVHIVGDVRLHRREQLAAELGTSHRGLARVCDTELVLRAYERWGSNCGRHLVGEGVFALWDERHQSLYCWRDAAGARPLYYLRPTSSSLVFSSDLRSIAAHPAARNVLDLPYVRASLESSIDTFRHPSRTYCEGVRKLPSANQMQVTEDRLTVEPYWRPEDVPPRHHAKDADYVEELRALIRAAVSDRLRHDRCDVGAHLSGGLDSSSVAVLATQEGAGRGVHAFSWAPSYERLPAFERDERRVAESAARFAGLELRFSEFTAADLFEVGRRDVALRPSTTLSGELSVSRTARTLGIRTMLSGWGGDESVVFNGRGYFADLARRGRWLTLQREFRRRRSVHDGGRTLGMWRARVFRPLLDARSPLPATNPDGLPGELHADFARALLEVDPLDPVDTREMPGVRWNQLHLLELGHLQYRMESWAAHGADFGLTYSYPLLDRRLVEFALAIPDRMYFKDGWKRWLYREAMEGILPDEVRWYPDKRDAAYNEQLRRCYPDARERLREALQTRSENPFVDVEILRHPESSNAARVGGGMWLAFTELGRP